VIEPEELAPRIAALRQALPQDGIRLACLFGSLAEGRPGRDVDLAVLFSDYRFERYIEILELARRILRVGSVDVTVLNQANAPLKLRALLEGRLLFAETATAHAEAVAEALFEYDDFRWFMAEYRRHLARRCQEGLSVADRRVDRERMEGHLSALDEAVAQLKRLQGRFASFEGFRSDVDTRELCVHYLRIALESVLDICRHFLAVVGVSLAELDTANLIELAGEKGLLEAAFAHRIRPPARGLPPGLEALWAGGWPGGGMAGMRNAIVHVYWRLDYQAIYRAVTEGLVDFDEFARQVREYLAKVEG